MDKNITAGINVLNNIYNDNEQLTSDNGDGEQLQGRRSLVNRYTLFSNRGKIIDDQSIKGALERNNTTEIPTVNTALSQNINRNNLLASSAANILRNPNAGAIIDYFKNTNFPVEYDWGDFLYCKYYGKIPGNHMITLRRYAGPIEDNIYSQALNSKLDVARIVTYMGEETGNSLKELLGMNFGLKYREQESEVQTVNSQRFNNPINNDFLNIFGALSSNTGAAGVASNFDKRNATNGGTDYDAWEVEGFYQNRIFGPVDVIDRMQVRDRGLEFNHTMTVSADYSLRTYGDISPKEALLDVLSNILVFSYANAPFWGGAVRVREDLRFHKLMGNQDSLKQGDFIGYFQSLIGDLGDKFQSIFSGGLAEAGKNLLKTASAFGANKLIDSKNMRREFQTVKALLSGEATGEWHMTIGNPLRPIAVIGNLICKDTVLEFDTELGLEDFPTSVKATFTLEPARPRDITDIESMFNAGKGRMYLPGPKAQKILAASDVSKNYYLAGNTDPNQKIKESPSQIKNRENALNSIKNGKIQVDDRFSKWNNDPGKIANALAFHPVIDKVIPKDNK